MRFCVCLVDCSVLLMRLVEWVLLSCWWISFSEVMIGVSRLLKLWVMLLVNWLIIFILCVL